MSNTREKIVLMEAYLNGDVIECLDKSLPTGKWEVLRSGEPEWNFTDFEYRIQPAEVCEEIFAYFGGCTFDPIPGKANLRLTFDGETGKLKKAEALGVVL